MDEAIAADLANSNYSIVDGFVDGRELSALRAEMQGLHAAGRLEAAALAGGARGSSETAYVQSDLRGDLVSWLDDDDESGLAHLTR